MIRYFSVAAALTFVAFSASHVVAQPAAAIVNGVVIPQSAVEEFLSELKKTGQVDTPELRRQIKAELVEREILVQEALRRGLDRSPSTENRLYNARHKVLVDALVRDESAKRQFYNDEQRAKYLVEMQKKLREAASVQYLEATGSRSGN